MDIKIYKQHLLDELYEPYRDCQMYPLSKLAENIGATFYSFSDIAKTIKKERFSDKSYK